MFRRALLGILLVLTFSATPPALAARAGTSCREAAAARAGVPAGLLAAIGMVESGARDHDGRYRPWPYTVDLDDHGYWFTSRPAAVAFVRAALGKGYTAIDVGCFQIDLAAHPHIFADLDQAFEPSANARAAARLLRRLHRRTGNWAAAVAAYHSTNPRLGVPYMRRVMTIWLGPPPASGRRMRALGHWAGVKVFGP